WLAWPPAAYLITVICLFAGLPVASVDLRGIHLEHAVAYYAALAAALVWLNRRPLQHVERPAAARHPRIPRLLPTGALAVLLALACGLLWLAASAPTPDPPPLPFLTAAKAEPTLFEIPEVIPIWLAA